MSDKSYRIHTNIAKDALLNVDMGQDFNFLEVLTLRLSQSDAYKLHSSSYGVVMGRILANDAFGIPNAKVSVFIEGGSEDVGSEIEALYPYVDTSSRDKEGRRYNLLPDYSDDKCYRVVGTFPNKRLVLDDNVMVEVFDKYYKFTTVTNASGDYMLFGVPSGSQTVHVDLDLSDIGVLSQKPRDFEYKGYNITMFDNPNQFKESTSIEGLAQIFSQDRGVFVYPFWGDEDNGIAAITRCDINIQYKFEPTCVFMGAIISDNDSNSIGHKCAPAINNGRNDQLIAGEGTIEMIRKTPDGLVEEFQIQGNQLINSDGVWCYQIPMNLDYIGMDECGNIVPTDNPSKGIPTRTQVRFRISKNESGGEGFSRHTAKYLVPMNPMFDKNKIVPTINVDGSEIEKMYEFGSSTPQSCFRDLYWNNVYSVKNYIPKVQVAHRPYASNYGALKGANLATDQNPIPFNKLKIDIPFSYMIICILFTIVMKIINVINAIVRALCSLKYFRLWILGRPFGWLPCPDCISLNAGIEDTNVSYYPGCGCPSSEACKHTDCPDEMGKSCIKKSDDIELEDKIQQNLATEYNVVKLDLYQDWINGTLYMPLWYWRKRKKKTYLFGLFSSRAKNEYCDCDKTYNRLKTAYACSLEYSNDSLKPKSIKESEEKWHKDRSHMVKYRRGLIKNVPNKDGLDVYYYVAIQATSDNANPNLPMSERKKDFAAIRLYATDIILLGNLNENNIYGIPQLFRSLPSTTSNVPAIAAIEESVNEESDYVSSGKFDIGGAKEDSGTVITTGMDWGFRGSRESPKYQRGLFLDLECTYANTKAKSCINVERLSELGTNLDMSYDKSYSNGSNNVEVGRIEADGFVTKLELDDEVHRAMFATMNHVGFVPQTYQDNYGTWYDTQVEDESTHYLIPKFKYIYPVDFDGRLQDIMLSYRNGFSQAMLDVRDESYLTFRFGAEKKQDKMGVRHFYKRYPSLAMPLYNNSFYFYFGVNKGKTAIEKFNELFDAQCFKNSTYPFDVSITSRGKVYCASIYKDSSDAYPYIRVTMDDIQLPFSYTLRDESGNIVIYEENMNITDFVIGGKIDAETSEVVTDNTIRYHDSGATEYGTLIDGDYRYGLTNQIYTLEVVDSYFKKVKNSVELSPIPLSIDFTSYALATKFYDNTTTPVSDIKAWNQYGKIIISGFSIDGYDFEISCNGENCYSDITPTPQDSGKTVVVTVSGKTPTQESSSEEVQPSTESKFNEPVEVYITFTLMEEGLTFKDVFGEVNDIFESETRGGKTVLILKVSRPSRWSITMNQKCDGKKVDENPITETCVVLNGEKLSAYLNDMPLLFMCGDLTSHEVRDENGKFYAPQSVTSATNPKMIGWYGVHQETTYLFNEPKYLPVNRNQDLWSDFANIYYDMNTPSTKHSILKFKFDAMFSLANSVYVLEGTNSTLTYKAKGGAPPILYQAMAPYYSSESSQTRTYLFSDMASVTVDSNFPNIVGSNYQHAKVQNSGVPQLNPAFIEGEDGTKYVGNYFVALTNDGGANTDIIPYKAYQKEKGENLLLPITDDIGQKVRGNSENNSYFRGMFVDRRLDYDLYVFPPFQGKIASLDKDSDEVPTWNYSRIMGKIYNGIEMSYDEWRNIISANDFRYVCCEDGAEDCEEGLDPCSEALVDYNGEVLSATPNTRLEYSYSYTFNNNGDEKTIYNIPTRTYWEDEVSSDDPNRNEKQIVKRFYDAKFNGEDIRNFFWSSFNKDSLSDYASDTTKNTSAYTEDGPMTYVVPGYESGDNSLFNGDFNLQSVTAGGYPTIRYIDLMNKSGSNYLSLNITSCSYNTPIEEEDGIITAEVRDGSDTDISFDYSNMIMFKPKNDDDKEYINVTMVYSGCYDSANGRHYGDHNSVCSGGTFHRNKGSLVFSYIPRIEDGYSIYSNVPTIIKVLPNEETSNMDGITYIKTAIDENDIQVRKGAVTIFDFFTTQIYGYYGISGPKTISLDVKHFFNQPTSHNDFSNVTFFVKTYYNYGGIDLSNVEVMSIEYENKYICNDGSNLKKGLHTVEFSSMYDLRDIIFCVDTASCACHYIDTDGRAQCTGGEGHEKEWSHLLRFFIDVEHSENTILEYPELLSFSFRFRRRGSPYYLSASEVEYETNNEGKITKVYLTTIWPPDMELGRDGTWRTNALFIQTNDGFVYGLEFGLEFYGLNNPTPDIKEGKRWYVEDDDD